MEYRSNFFKYASAILIVLAITFLLNQLHFFFETFFKFVKVLAAPVLVAGLFYYLLRPFIRLAEENRVPRALAIGILFIIGMGFFIFITLYIGAFIQNQTKQLVTNLPQIILNGEARINELLHPKYFGINFSGNLGQQFTAALRKVLPFLTGHILQTLSALTG
ncbi:MAG TPA: hypothetical protein DDW50_07470, partial [Firmicutes bacterium]|nr:hypothetical protein [Bacillota bacterium]